MRPSTHYYVLSLSETRNALFEAFRDQLIDVQNQGFPLRARAPSPADRRADARRLELMRTVDRQFGRYQTREPLGLVVVGVPEWQAAFDAVTVHRAAILGRVAGDHALTPARSLGQIVWPVVREAISGVLDRAMRELRASREEGDIQTGMQAVTRAAGREARATLLVEDDFHLRGTLRTVGEAVVMSPEVDVRDTIDDAVDRVIEDVLGAAGHVVFTPPGTLRDCGRIALLPPERPRAVAGRTPPTGRRNPN